MLTIQSAYKTSRYNENISGQVYFVCWPKAKDHFKVRKRTLPLSRVLETKTLKRQAALWISSFLLEKGRDMFSSGTSLPRSFFFIDLENMGKRKLDGQSTMPPIEKLPERCAVNANSKLILTRPVLTKM